MSHLLERAARPEILNAAWKRLRNDKAIWEPGVSRRDLEANLVGYFLKLANELRTGTYVPNSARFFPVNKGDGKQRIISTTTLRDKVAQRAVLNVIEPIGEKVFHPDSFGYRPGRSVEMALRRVREYMMCGMTWVVDADIEACFDNIPHKPLIKALKSLISDGKVVALTKRWLDAGTVRRGFLSKAKGIPQGAVLSPFLCNAYLTRWDNDMAGMNLPFVRFADDFLVFARSRGDAVEAHAYIEKSLGRLELTLNAEKTNVVRCGPHVKFLGRRLPRIGQKASGRNPFKKR